MKCHTQIPVAWNPTEQNEKPEIPIMLAPNFKAAEAHKIVYLIISLAPPLVCERASCQHRGSGKWQLTSELRKLFLNETEYAFTHIWGSCRGNKH